MEQWTSAFQSCCVHIRSFFDVRLALLRLFSPGAFTSFFASYSKEHTSLQRASNKMREAGSATRPRHTLTSAAEKYMRTPRGKDGRSKEQGVLVPLFQRTTAGTFGSVCQDRAEYREPRLHTPPAHSTSAGIRLLFWGGKGGREGER
jgi:hypothetical protein